MRSYLVGQLRTNYMILERHKDPTKDKKKEPDIAGPPPEEKRGPKEKLNSCEILVTFQVFFNSLAATLRQSESSLASVKEKKQNKREAKISHAYQRSPLNWQILRNSLYRTWSLAALVLTDLRPPEPLCSPRQDSLPSHQLPPNIKRSKPVYVRKVCLSACQVRKPDSPPDATKNFISIPKLRISLPFFVWANDYLLVQMDIRPRSASSLASNFGSIRVWPPHFPPP